MPNGSITASIRAHTAGDVELFQAQMLTEMAGMSVEDGLTMQLHPGSVRNYNKVVYDKFGRDKAPTSRRRPSTAARCVRCLSE